MAEGIKIFIAAVSPALLAKRVTGFGHAGEKVTFGRFVFAFGSGKIAGIVATVIDKYRAAGYGSFH